MSLLSMSSHVPDPCRSRVFESLNPKQIEVLRSQPSSVSLSCVRCCAPPVTSQIPTALLGYQLFDSAISWQMGEFMVVSMTGGFMYSFAKLKVNGCDFFRGVGVPGVTALSLSTVVCVCSLSLCVLFITKGISMGSWVSDLPRGRRGPVSSFYSTWRDT